MLRTPIGAVTAGDEMLWNLSRMVHDTLYRDTSQSLCARAYDLHREHIFWRIWMRVFGPLHCARSFHHHRRKKPWTLG